MNTTKVVKVQPYPFSALISKTEGVPPVRGAVLKLTEVGLLVRMTAETFFKVGENLFKLEFDIPASDVTIIDPVKVIKTYDNMADNGSGILEKVYLVEFHFRTLSADDKSAIQSFIKRIGQK